MASKEPRWPQSKNKLISRYGIDAQGNTHVEINGISATLENELSNKNGVSLVVAPIQERPWLGCTSWSSKIWHSPLFSPHFCLKALATLCIRWTLYAHTLFFFSFFLLEDMISLSFFCYTHHTSTWCCYTHAHSLFAGSSTQSFATTKWTTLVGRVHQKEEGLSKECKWEKICEVYNFISAILTLYHGVPSLLMDFWCQWMMDQQWWWCRACSQLSNAIWITKNGVRMQKLWSKRCGAEICFSENLSGMGSGDSGLVTPETPVGVT